MICGHYHWLDEDQICRILNKFSEDKSVFENTACTRRFELNNNEWFVTLSKVIPFSLD